MNIQNAKIGIIALRYAGLPLSVEFGKQRPVLGFDVKSARIAELQSGQDGAPEASCAGPKHAARLGFSLDSENVKINQAMIGALPSAMTSASTIAPMCPPDGSQ